MIQFQSTPQAAIQQFQSLANQIEQFEAQNEQLLRQLRQVESQNAHLLNQLAQREQQAQQQIRQLVQTGLQMAQQYQNQQIATQQHQQFPHQSQFGSSFTQHQFPETNPFNQPQQSQFSQLGQFGTGTLGQSLSPQSIPQFA